MNKALITLAGATLTPLPSGALWWADEGILAVSDLHFGKSERLARMGGGMLPPYETRDTLDRLDAVVREISPKVLISLGDCFDDMIAVDAVLDEVLERLRGMAAGRRWIWIAGNHDPGPVELPGTNLAEYRAGPLIFRHIAEPGAVGEVTGHYHPKMRVWLGGSHISRPCFLSDNNRVILPAFGTYTGGLDVTSDVFDPIIDDDAIAWLTGRKITALPRNIAETMQRSRQRSQARR